MAFPYSYQYRKFGAAASTIALCKSGGGVLKGFFVSAKGTSPSISVYDCATTGSVAAATLAVASHAPTGVGLETLDMAFGKGLVVKCASCTFTALYVPASY